MGTTVCHATWYDFYQPSLGAGTVQERGGRVEIHSPFMFQSLHSSYTALTVSRTIQTQRNGNMSAERTAAPDQPPELRAWICGTWAPLAVRWNLICVETRLLALSLFHFLVCSLGLSGNYCSRVLSRSHALALLSLLISSSAALLSLPLYLRV